MAQKFTNCTITIYGVSDGIGQTQTSDNTTVHLYD